MPAVCVNYLGFSMSYAAALLRVIYVDLSVYKIFRFKKIYKFGKTLKSFLFVFFFFTFNQWRTVGY